MAVNSLFVVSTRLLLLSLSLLSFLPNTYAAPADGVVFWNDADKDSHIALSGSDLIAEVTGADPGVFAVRSNSAISSGDGFFYFEIEQLVSDREFAVGVATASAPLTAADVTTVALNAETGVTQVFPGVVGVFVDYRGTNPVVYAYGNRFGLGTFEFETIEMGSVTSPIYLYMASEGGAQHRLNFGGTNGASFTYDPATLIEDLIFNGGTLLEFGMPIARAKPTIAITEGSQLVQQNGSATFNVTAMDADSADLSSSVNWLLDGVSIGTGGSISPSATTAGSYQLTAEVEDSTELSSSTTVNFYVHPTTGGDLLDHDGDGLTYAQEITATTNPANPDSDGDGLSDGYEVANSSSPTNGADPASPSVTAHEDSVFFNFEAGTTSRIVSVSDDGLSVGYIPGIDGKAAIRANQGMNGEFRYWEGLALFDDDMGIGLIGPNADIDDYCCVSGDLTGAPPSMSVNMIGPNPFWRNLVAQGNFVNNDAYVGLAVDYSGASPIVYIIGSSGVQGILTLSDYVTTESIFPMLYGNTNGVTRGPVAVNSGNFGETPFFYDVRQILTDAAVDIASFVPGWGKYRQLQHLNLDVLSQTVTAGTEITLNATATDALGVDSTSSIVWNIFDAADTNVTASLATVAPPVTGGSITFTPLTAETFTVSAQITDSKTGRVFTRSSMITVDDDAPVVTAPVDITVVATSGSSVPSSNTDIQTFLAGGSATDAVDGSVSVSVSGDLTDYPVGSTTTITFSATDAAGNTGTATSTITVTDGGAPTVSAPTSITVVATSGSSVPSSNTDIQTFLAGGSATDAVDGSVSVSVSGDLTDYPVGSTTTITFSATDAAGNTGTATSTITVTDGGAPTVSAPTSITVVATSGSSVPSSNTDIQTFLAGGSATDAVDGSVSVSVSGDLTDYPVGSTTTITFSATDAAGNTGTATSTITVTDGGAPTVSAPTSITVVATSGSSVPSSNTDIQTFLAGGSATDAVDGSVSVSVSGDLTDYPVGSTTTITFSATDAAGNTGTATSTITVTDGGAPTVSAPTSITVVATSGSSVPSSNTDIQTFLAGGSATDAVDGSVSVSVSGGLTDYPVGSTTTITFSATDAAGNTGTATSTITVTDGGAPTVSAPTSITVVATSGSSVPSSNTDIQTFLAGGSATDAVDGSVSVSVSGDLTDYPVGSTTTITFSATDAAGNTGTATSTITVTDGGAPEVTAPSDLPITINSGSSVAASDSRIVTFLAAASATDNVGVVGEITNNAPSSFPVGTTTVTFTATDVAGNSGTATADVVITFTDIDAPEVTAPGDLAITINSGSSVAASDSRIVTFLAAASATDNVGVVGAITNNAPSNFPVGTTTVTFTATDAAGNSATATAVVIITASDSDAPIVTPPTDISVPLFSGLSVSENNAAISAFLSGATATDGVDGVLNVSLSGNLASYPVGSTTITFSATDQAGNTGIATSTITVTDNGAPTLTAPEDITISIGSGQTVASSDPLIVAFLNAAVATDDVEGSLVVENNVPSEFPVGVTIVTFSVADSSGNIAQDQTALVNVVTTVLGNEDSDGDGTSDVDEGFTDFDGDRIPDYLDNSTVDTQIQAGHNDAFLQTEPGLKLILGETSFASENASILIDQDNLSAFGGAGGVAVTNGVDDFYEYPSGMFDFEVLGLTTTSASVVIPLSSALPANAVYRKYTEADGWNPFIEDANNSIASAPGQLGTCPAPGDTAYTPGLTEGDFCIQLTIEDGGNNDSDGEVNGVVKDPGGIAVLIPEPNVDLSRSSTSTIFTNGSGEQVVLAFAVASDSRDAQVNRLTLNSSGTLDEAADIDAVNLYHDVNANGILDSDDELVGSGSYSSDNGQLEFSLSTPVSLSIGNTQFLVTYSF